MTAKQKKEAYDAALPILAAAIVGFLLRVSWSAIACRSLGLPPITFLEAWAIVLTWKWLHALSRPWSPPRG